ncbi:MAG TPA: hypothetical protein VMB82_06820, partial [Acidimicrobiales bacterium]|nr:hypothetical protein [Acidimicrobiales bacterium]
RESLPVPHEQSGNPTYAEKLLPGELELDWRQPAAQLLRVVRLGRAWTTVHGRRLRVLAAGPADDGPAIAPGCLEGVVVGAGGGSRLKLETVQPEGKRPMDAASWLLGAKLRPGDRLGTDR